MVADFNSFERVEGSALLGALKLYFTPTSASWLNLVERFFAEITTEGIRRGTFTSVAELQAAIHDCLDTHNADPKPFRLDQNRRCGPRHRRSEWRSSG